MDKNNNQNKNAALSVPFIVAFVIFGVLNLFGYIKKDGYQSYNNNANDNNQNKFQIRKEYSDDNKNKNNDNIKNIKEKIN